MSIHSSLYKEGPLRFPLRYLTAPEARPRIDAWSWIAAPVGRWRFTRAGCLRGNRIVGSKFLTELMQRAQACSIPPPRITSFIEQKSEASAGTSQDQHPIDFDTLVEI